MAMHVCVLVYEATCLCVYAPATGPMRLRVYAYAPATGPMRLRVYVYAPAHDPAVVAEYPLMIYVYAPAPDPALANRSRSCPP